MAVGDVLEDLVARGLVQDSTDREALAARLAAGHVTLYWGCDPTADSLHIGNLVGILVVRRFRDAGHRPLALAGGATGMIGDPSGRSSERNLLDEATLARNLAGIRHQLQHLAGVPLVDNATWTADLRLLDFLRDVGKHLPVGAVLGKEAVRSRMGTGEGISFTEFSYPLLQAHDYLWLHEHEGCELQVGGSEQWGNITLGADLIRRRTGHVVHGLTWPLLTRADGRKFGKSEGDDNVWLSAERTSPYRFFQHWLNVPDADVERFLLQLTLLPVAEAEAVATEHLADPARRVGQRRLAAEVTTLVHGAEATATVEAASRVVFGGPLEDLPAGALAALDGELDTTVIDSARLAAGLGLVDVLVEVELASSRSDARRRLEQGGVTVNGRPPAPGPDGGVMSLGPGDVREGRFVLLGSGRRSRHLLRVD